MRRSRWRRVLFLATLVVVAILVAPSFGQQGDDGSLGSSNEITTQDDSSSEAPVEVTSEESTAPPTVEEESETLAPVEESEETPAPTAAEEVVEETDPPVDTPSPVKDTPVPDTPSPLEEVSETPSPVVSDDSDVLASLCVRHTLTHLTNITAVHGNVSGGTNVLLISKKNETQREPQAMLEDIIQGIVLGLRRD